MYSTYLFGVLVSSFDVIACCSPFNFLFSVLINLFVQQSNMFSPIVLISYICVCVYYEARAFAKSCQAPIAIHAGQILHKKLMNVRIFRET